MFNKFAVLLLCFVIFTCFAIAQVAQVPDSFTDKVAGYPDVWQEDPQGNFPGGGSELCCPSCISNSLLYFANHGFASLVPEQADTPFETHAALIRLLASKKYLNTNLSSGTPPGRMIYGAQRYITECGYKIERLEYEGWRPIGKEQQGLIIAPLPSVEWLKQGIADPNGMVWLNVGWYRKGDEEGTWVRTGGHWVTLVGYGPGSNDLLVHNSLIHRPEPVTDSSEYGVSLTALPADSTFTVLNEGEIHSTEGMFRVEGPGLPTRRSVAFLDGAILVVLGK